MSRIAPYWPQTENSGRVPTLTPAHPRPDGGERRPPLGWDRPRWTGRQPTVISRARQGEFTAPSVNVGDAERTLSAVGGSVLALYGLSRGSLGGLVLAGVGGCLLYRGLSGHCSLYQSAGLNTAEPHGTRTAIPAGAGCKVEASISINKPAAELFRFWRDFENLPKVMRHLQSVKVTGNKSHWVAQAPLGMSVSWDAEVITERPNELIGWRSLPGSMVDTAGSVHFRAAHGNRGTEVRVTLKYDPPAGKVGATVASWLGESPEKQIAEDLATFKRLMEAGETAVTTGQRRN